MNDQFGSWDEFLQAVENQSQVRVLGVTDYCLLENYSKLKAYRDAGRLKDIEYVIPNLEFRLAPPTDKDTAVNIHLLVCPDDPQHETHISNALARLHWQYNHKRYSCTKPQLMSLGLAVDPSITSEKDALSKGVEQFKIDFSAFRDWYFQEPWLRSNSLVAVSGNKDGLSGFLVDGGWAAMREEITRLSAIIFSGRPGEAEFWIGAEAGKNQDFMFKLGGPKPCVHGSDAHELSKLFKPDEDRFCWIKADPTFEGLKQILLEPADRVYIGPTPPLYHDSARVIESVTLRRTNGWFNEETIPLNPGLVSIIGQKGSGKSALAELIAYGAGSWEPTDGSFLGRAGSHLDGLEVELKWGDGHATTEFLGRNFSAVGNVRFLSQRFVEKLCANDELGEDLVREIEAVIFDALDPTDTLNASTFQELRELRTDTTREEGEHLREEMLRLIRDETALRQTLGKIPEKQQRLTKLIEEADGLKKQMPQPASAEEAKTQADLLAARSKLGQLQADIGTHKQKRQKLVDVRGRIQGVTRELDRFRDEIKPILVAADILEGDHSLFVPAFPSGYDAVLKARDAALVQSIAALEGTPENPESLLGVQASIDRLSKLESDDKARHDRVKGIQTRLAAIDVEMQRLSTEIGQREAIRSEIESSRKKRLDAYIAFFSNLADEQKILEELYKPVHDKLAHREHEQDLQFSIRWEADLDRWIARGSQLMDQRKAVPYGTIDGMRQQATQLLVAAWTSGDPVRVGKAHEKFMEEFRKLPPSDYLRNGVTFEELLTWLYDVDQVGLNYGLKYRGTDLEKLSPGTKGIVLLILYLGLDERDTRPLVVDQPDENLDNESIFELLTTYFRSAKRRRQIILITHNPNLVVNGDSEQVVVATARIGESGLPYISYVANSLENSAADETGIRQRTCKILEGGTKAFQRRERRYALVA
nr:AAA family ATPase [Devosia sp. MC1541]